MICFNHVINIIKYCPFCSLYIFMIVCVVNLVDSLFNFGWTIIQLHGTRIFRHLRRQMYEHWLKYSMGIRLLSGSIVTEEQVELADILIQDFVRDYEKFYGKSVSYVVHILLHMPYFARLLGSLYSFSTYRLENRLGILKKDVRKKYQVSQQL